MDPRSTSSSGGQRKRWITSQVEVFWCWPPDASMVVVNSPFKFNWHKMMRTNYTRNNGIPIKFPAIKCKLLAKSWSDSELYRPKAEIWSLGLGFLVRSKDDDGGAETQLTWWDTWEEAMPLIMIIILDGGRPWICVPTPSRGWWEVRLPGMITQFAN